MQSNDFGLESAANDREAERPATVPLTTGLAAAFDGMADAFDRLSEHASYLAEEARRIAKRDR